jgi:peroxiredoxin
LIIGLNRLIHETTVVSAPWIFRVHALQYVKGTSVKRTTTTLIIIVLIAMLASWAACDKTRHEQPAGSVGQETKQPAEKMIPQKFGIGLPAPDFTLQDIHGQEISLLEHRGKAVVVDFWATWCAPCRIAMPHLQALSQQYPDQLVVLAISLDQDPLRVVPPFAAQLGLTFSLLADPRGVLVAQQWGGVSSIPTAYLIDPEGVVVEKWVGVKSRQEYDRRIRRVLGLDT